MNKFCFLCWKKSETYMNMSIRAKNWTTHHKKQRYRKSSPKISLHQLGQQKSMNICKVKFKRSLLLWNFHRYFLCVSMTISLWCTRCTTNHNWINLSKRNKFYISLKNPRSSRKAYASSLKFISFLCTLVQPLKRSSLHVHISSHCLQ